MSLFRFPATQLVREGRLVVLAALLVLSPLNGPSLAAQSHQRFEPIERAWWLPVEATDNPFDQTGTPRMIRLQSEAGETFDWPVFATGERRPGEARFVARFFLVDPGRWTITIGDHVDTLTIEESPWPPIRHGPVRVAGDNPFQLVHRDGEHHYWIGGKWFSATSFAPCSTPSGSQPCSSPRLVDEYLELLAEKEHNGVLLKVATYPVQDDRVSWDHEWAENMADFVARAAARGIYVQLNIFDTWGRRHGSKLGSATDGNDQVLDPWSSRLLDEKLSYLRNLVARFGGFPNVYWELGNEMEHSPNCGACFAELANRYYLPWLRELDVHDRPVALSEEVWQDTDVDIALLHQSDDRPDPARELPYIMNELVRGGSAQPWWRVLLRGPRAWHIGTRPALWRDETIRDPFHRYDYRSTFWGMLASGGAGSSEATWLNVSESPNQAVLDVMEDHRRVAQFLSCVPRSLRRHLRPAEPWVWHDGSPLRAARFRDALWMSYLAISSGTDASRRTLRFPDRGVRQPILAIDPRTLFAQPVPAPSPEAAVNGGSSPVNAALEVGEDLLLVTGDPALLTRLRRCLSST